MRFEHATEFYIEGGWVQPEATIRIPVIDPSTEEHFVEIAGGDRRDVDRAMVAARKAFPAFSQTTRTERLDLLRSLLAAYRAREEEIAQTVSREMGAPIAFAREAQAWAGKVHLESTIAALESFDFEEQRGDTRILREGIGVAALITPWNWPLNQIVCKVAPALAAGCTMVLKPSEIAPLSGLLFAGIVHEAGVPAGVFNLVNGDGPSVGQVMASHPEADMVSFTGSTRAGVIVAQAAAPTVKRVSQELGGKSPNILLDDADFPRAVAEGAAACFANAGQSCDAPTRMLVPLERHAEVLEIAAMAASREIVGDPRDPATTMGPLVSQGQFDKVQRLIEAGIAEGAQRVAGGPGRPSGLNRGYYVQPTVFGGVTPNMTVAREEIFGPVLSIMPYRDEAEAVRMANDTPYGLAAYVQSSSLDRVRAVARQLRAGTVTLNGAGWDTFAPFGGYKQSGNGREYADWGIGEFLEIKGIVGHGAG